MISETSQSHRDTGEVKFIDRKLVVYPGRHVGPKGLREDSRQGSKTACMGPHTGLRQ